MDYHLIWGKTLEILENTSSSITYTTVFAPLRPLAADNNIFFLECKDEFHKSFCLRESKQIEQALKQASPFRYALEFVLPGNETNDRSSSRQKKKEAKLSSGYTAANLNKSLSFENFVVGKGNDFAYSVCHSVVKNHKTDLSNNFNPLFLYGGSGLGKTHLTQAIGNYVVEHFPEKRVVYVQCETFLNEFIATIASKSFEPFRHKYRNCDFLLIDDIQFMQKKEGMQEEFFHTFNTLYENGSQIVLTCDKPPSQLNSLEERLITRFSSGVLVDIQAPDYETRLAILRNLCIYNKVDFPDDVIDYIASNISSNVRELEGAFKKVLAYTLLDGQVSLSRTMSVLHDMINPQGQKKITTDLIMNVTSSYFNISVEDLKSPRRNRSIVFPRQITMYFFRVVLNMTYNQIGEFFGKSDHTSAINACDKIEDVMNERKQPECDQIEELRKRIAF